MILRALAFLLCAGTATAAEMPNTDAGEQFAAWLAVFNRGDGPAMAKYLDEHFPANKMPVADYVRLDRDTGGLELAQVSYADVSRVMGTLKARRGEGVWRFVMTLNPMDPSLITSFELARSSK